MVEPHFWFAVALPAAIALVIAWRNHAELWRNAGIWVVATTLTVGSAFVDIRSFLGLTHDPFGVYAFPLFLVVYLVAGRYRTASAAVCFAGTFASLLVTDLVVFAYQWSVGAPDAIDTLVGIGAGKPVDGLLFASAGAGVAASLVRAMERQGVEMRLFRSRMKR